MRDDPALIDGVTMEPPAQMIANAPPRHPRQRLLDDLALPLESALGVVPAREQELESGRVREFGRRAEAAIAHVERPRYLIRRRRYQLGIHGAGLRFVQRLGDVLSDRAGIRHDAIRLLTKRARNFLEYPAKARTPVWIVVGREIGSAEEHFTVGCQERGERPATLATQCLHRALIARVDVGTLVAVHLDADEVAIEDLGDSGIVVGLPIHHMAPVAPDRADIEQNRLAFRTGAREGCVVPGMPVHRLMGRRLEVSRSLCAELIHAGSDRYCTAVRLNNSAPITSDSSSISNVGL